LTPTKRICQCQTDDAKNIPAMQANARLFEEKEKEKEKKSIFDKLFRGNKK
jgi:hypothetical protein